MKRVLLTGASGFIGRQAIAILRGRGYEVHAVSVRSKGADGDVVWHQADLLHAGHRRELMNSVRPSHVLHFAWIATPGIYWTSPLNEEWKVATLDLCELSKEFGVRRFVGAGTCAEYDWSSGYCDERTTPVHPVTPYGIAKAAAGQAVVDMSGNMSTAWGRIFFLYGLHEHPKRLVSSVILALLRGEKAPCSHGRQVRDFLHVNDVAGAFVALLESGVTGAVNIASGEPVTIRHVVEAIARQLKAEDLVQFGAIPAPAHDPERLEASVERLQQEVGWHPAFTLDEGIAETIEWWRLHGGKGVDRL